MDRSEEFLRVAEIFVSEGPEKGDESALQLGPRLPLRFSEFLQTVLVTYGVIQENEELVKRISRLASMKEFSGDSTLGMEELSKQFEMKIKFIQNSLQKLKLMTEKGTAGNQDSQHRQIVSQYLSKIISNHVQSFKLSLKEHAKNVEERNKRVQKYGNISSASQSSLLSDASQTSKYAMFSNVGLADSSPLVHIEKNQALRNRRPAQLVRNVPTVNHSQQQGSNTSQNLQDNIDEDGNDKMKGKSRYEPPRSSLFQQHMTNRDNSHKQPISNSAYAMNISSPYAFNANQNAAQPQQTAQIQKPVTIESRLHHAQRIESSIREMGQLFSQMASLIAEQSEVITRIEDDVEIGHQNTVEGYSSIQQAYEITKGNRGMIIKIFLILIFCIFLFLVWT